MALPLLLLWACSQNDVLKIEGTITNAEEKTLYLDKLHVASTESLDSITLDEDGDFRFKIKTDKPEFYILRLSNGKLITLLAEPGQKIELSGEAPQIDLNYNVEGSKGSRLVKELNEKLLETKETIENIRTKLKEKQGDPDIDNIYQELNNQYLAAIKSQRDYSINFIMKNATSMASYMALYQKLDQNTYTLNENSDIKYVKIVATSMKALYPESEYTIALLHNMEEMQKRLNNLKIREIIEQTGISLPEIELPDTKGKKIKLSSLKNKFVILNFWSAQDPGSHKVNQTLKKIYRRYHNRGLEIYQVCVDQNKLLWQNRVKRDKLGWINVCDPGNGSARAVQSFNIKQIPAIYLIDKRGEIVGKNLFGNDLEEKIKELLN